MELLTSQHIEKCSSSLELAEQSLHEIQDFKQSKANEFQSCLQESSTLESKPLVKQVSYNRNMKKKYNIIWCSYSDIL